MNWGEFKKQVEEYGIIDAIKIDVIDTSGCWGDDWDLEITEDVTTNQVSIYAYDKPLGGPK